MTNVTVIPTHHVFWKVPGLISSKAHFAIPVALKESLGDWLCIHKTNSIVLHVKEFAGLLIFMPL